MKLRTQSKRRVRVWRGSRAPIRAYEGDPELLPPPDLIAEALREAAEQAAKGANSRWANRDRSKPANPWSGKA